MAGIFLPGNSRTIQTSQVSGHVSLYCRERKTFSSTLSLVPEGLWIKLSKDQWTKRKVWFAFIGEVAKEVALSTWLQLKVSIPSLMGERKGEEFLWGKQTHFLRKDKQVFQEHKPEITELAMVSSIQVWVVFPSPWSQIPPEREFMVEVFVCFFFFFFFLGINHSKEDFTTASHLRSFYF